MSFWRPSLLFVQDKRKKYAWTWFSRDILQMTSKYEQTLYLFVDSPKVVEVYPEDGPNSRHGLECWQYSYFFFFAFRRYLVRQWFLLTGTLNIDRPFLVSDFILLIRPIIINHHSQHRSADYSDCCIMTIHLWENSEATRVSVRRMERRIWGQLLSQGYWSFSERNSSGELSIGCTSILWSSSVWTSLGASEQRSLDLTHYRLGLSPLRTLNCKWMWRDSFVFFVCWSGRGSADRPYCAVIIVIIWLTDPSWHFPLFLWLLVSCLSKVVVEGQLRILDARSEGKKQKDSDKQQSQTWHTGIRLGSPIPVGDEVFFEHLLVKGIHGDENNVCSWRTTTLHFLCHLNWWCDICHPLFLFVWQVRHFV